MIPRTWAAKILETRFLKFYLLIRLTTTRRNGYSRGLTPCSQSGVFGSLTAKVSWREAGIRPSPDCRMNLSKMVRVSGGWHCQVHVSHTASRSNTTRSRPRFEDMALWLCQETSAMGIGILTLTHERKAGPRIIRKLNVFGVKRACGCRNTDAVNASDPQPSKTLLVTRLSCANRIRVSL